jgi:hypothetical protein
MQKKPLHLLVVIMLLAASALACNTVMGGRVDDLTEDDIQATADALGFDDAEATIAAAETEAADIIDDNGDDNPDDNGNTDDNGDDNGSTDSPFSDGPENIPVLDDNAELLYADDVSLTYYTDASFDDTVDFYREEMINAGWEASANGDNVFGEIASLQYQLDGATALVAVTVDPTSSRTLVAITITQ